MFLTTFGVSRAGSRTRLTDTVIAAEYLSPRAAPPPVNLPLASAAQPFPPLPYRSPSGISIFPPHPQTNPHRDQTHPPILQSPSNTLIEHARRFRSNELPSAKPALMRPIDLLQAVGYGTCAREISAGVPAHEASAVLAPRGKAGGEEMVGGGEGRCGVRREGMIPRERGGLC